jgi:divalent metal cation (Fe/Co/Zn/Cd) transporter
LAWFTIVYNLVEGLVSIAFGLSEESIALLGFGSDSLVEVASATVVLWRLRGESGRGPGVARERERRAASSIGWLFLLLAVGVAAGSVLQLATASHPATTLPGLIVSSLSLSFMVWLWRSKLEAARALNSRTVEMDAACSLACIKLSAVLFVGSLLFLVAPALWWSDAVAALVLAFFIGREGWEGIEAARKPDFDGGCGCSHD